MKIKKWIIGIVLAWVCMTGSLWGGTLGDVNGDGAVGLPEAVHALQVTSGIRPQTVVQDTFDFTEYFTPVNSSYRFLVTPTGGATTTPSEMQLLTTSETIDGKNYLVWNFPPTMPAGIITSLRKDYYLLGPTEIAWAYTSGEYTMMLSGGWMNPPLVIGSRSMQKGDMFCNFFKRTDPAMPYITTGIHYDEFVFAGVEDVTVPAGVFTNCLKILRRTGAGVYLSYFARNVGLVKYLYSNNEPSMTSGYVWELSFCAVNPTASCTGQGTWDDPDYPFTARSGQLAFTSYQFQDGKITALLELKEFIAMTPPTSSMLSMVSTDGTHFSPDPDVYGINPPTLSVTISEGVLSGSYTPTETLTHHLSVGEPVTQSVRVVTLTGTVSCTP